MGKEYLNTFKGQDDLFDHQLRFNLKVSSLRTSSGLMAHPDKKLAGTLLEEDSENDNYHDNYHKPKVMVALSDDVILLHGFADPETIKHNMEVNEVL